MDPITAGFNAATAALTLAGKLWDAMPADQKSAAAADWGKFTHNIGAFITSMQDKVNAAVAVAK